MWYVVLIFKDDIFKSDFLRSLMQFQHHSITSHKWSDQNNEKFYHVKQTVENRRPSKMGDVATLLYVHFNFIIQFQNMFLSLKSIHIAYWVKFMLCLLSFIMLCFCFCFCFLKICIIIQWYICTYILYSEKNDVQCFSLLDFVGPLWGIRCTY